MKYPDLQHRMSEADEELERETAEFLQSRSGSDGPEYLIPVVFHIIHNNGPENISDAQVHDAMEVLNRDFNKENADTADVVEQFQGIIGDTNIRFKLAQLDPNGNCTNGILRVQDESTYDGDSDMKDVSRWPRDMYLNVWVCNSAGGAAGYTFLPGSVNGFFGQLIDGIVLRYDYTGRIGTSNENRSRTLTHEVGHWLNLRHTWGGTNEPGLASNCQSGDNVNDTPNTVGWTSCVPNGQSCGGLDNVQNYMEYSYCSNMFTTEQSLRMRAALNSLTAERFNLWQDENLTATGVTGNPVLCVADFTAEQQFVCSGTPVNFIDQSYNDPAFYVWDFGDGTVIEGTDLTNPSHNYTSSGDYTVTLTISDGNTEITESKTNFITVLDNSEINLPFIEGWEASLENIEANDTWESIGNSQSANWELTNNASFSGLTSATIQNLNNLENDEDELVSATMDFTGASEIVINYRYAFATTLQPSDDRLRCYISNDCGFTWSQRSIHRGFTDLPTATPTSDSFAPNGPDEWASHEIIIDDQNYISSSFRVKFRFQNFGGNNVYLDNINIGTAAQVNVGEINPLELELSLYPNPTGADSQLEFFALQRLTDCKIEIYSSTGRLISSIFSGDLTQGEHRFPVSGAELAKGVYVVRIQSELVTDQKTWIIR
ncbi:MAG: M43 family zinc metalloprotease [Flavobacteriales bacterium]